MSWCRPHPFSPLGIATPLQHQTKLIISGWVTITLYHVIGQHIIWHPHDARLTNLKLCQWPLSSCYQYFYCHRMISVMYFLACCRVYILQFIVGDYADRGCWLWQMLCYSNDNYGAHEVYLWLVHGMGWIFPRMWFRGKRREKEREGGREGESERELHSHITYLFTRWTVVWFEARMWGWKWLPERMATWSWQQRQQRILGLW